MRISFLDNYKFLVLKNLIAFAFFLVVVLFAMPSYSRFITIPTDPSRSPASGPPATTASTGTTANPAPASTATTASTGTTANPAPASTATTASTGTTANPAPASTGTASPPTQCNDYKDKSSCTVGEATVDKDVCNDLYRFCIDAYTERQSEDISIPDNNCDGDCVLRIQTENIRMRERAERSEDRARDRFDGFKRDIRQKFERDKTECRKEIRDMNRTRADLPPGCRARGGECLTDAQKCRRVRESIGAAGVLNVQFQGQLATECPQVAKAQFDENSDKLEELEGKLEDHQEFLQDERAHELKELQEYEQASRKNQRDIQKIATGMEQMSVDLNRELSQPPQGITEQMNQIRLDALNINRLIREKARRLTQLQSNDTEEADTAARKYQSELRRIAAACNVAGRKAIDDERRHIRQQAENRQTTQNLRQASEDPADRLRLVGARAYASCRNSAESQNTIEAARHDYQFEQRKLRRQEGELIDQIKDLEKELVAMNEQLDTLVNEADKIFDARQEGHRRGISEAVRALNDLQHEGRILKFNYDNNETLRQSKVAERLQQFNVDNGTYMALQQAVEAGRPGSYFGNESYGNYESIDSFAAQYENAHHTCCDNDRNLDPKLCSSNSAERYLRSGSSRSGRSRGAR